MLFLFVEFVFSTNPGDLVREEVFAEKRVFVDRDGRKYGAHIQFWILDFGFWIWKKDFRSQASVHIVLKTTKRKL